MKELLKDKNGKASSKRIIGIICVAIGLIMALATTFIFIYHAIETGQAIEIENLRFIFTAIFTAGGGLLGVGVFENKK